MVEISLPREYGYVVLTFFASILLMFYLTIKVALARRKYNIKYPTLYAKDDEKDGKIFNCIQRCHQNTLESYSMIVISLLVGGIQHPLIASTSGAVWIASRFVYAHFYSKGEVSKRNYGAFGTPFTFALYFTVASFGLRLAELI